jgi:hypothetical protein
MIGIYCPLSKNKALRSNKLQIISVSIEALSTVNCSATAAMLQMALTAQAKPNEGPEPVVVGLGVTDTILMTIFVSCGNFLERSGHQNRL